MKKIFVVFLFLSCVVSQAQQFISSGMIEFEVKKNNHKIMGDDSWTEMFKDKIPVFSTTWYSFTFNGNKSIYKYDREDEKTKMPRGFGFGNNNDDENIWYNDYASGSFVDQKFVYDNTYLLSDSLMNIEWKISPNETREIAGFVCRKATGIIFDSVYVFAFYTDEITVSGGPMGIHGLPGMIMGVTIPRMYTSWIATKLQVNGVNTSIISAPKKGKQKKAAELQETVKKVTKDWGKWGQQQVWNLFL